MLRIISLLLTALIFSGCAAPYPPVSELKKGVKSAVFIQQGLQPTKMKFGIVDTASFWKDFGYTQSVLVTSNEVERPEADKIMRKLFGNNPMVSKLTQKLMPLYAHEWGVRYDPKKLYVMKKGRVDADKNGYMSGIKTTADAVFVLEVPLVRFNEKKSFGGALLAGFTLGTNEKDVTAEMFATITAYKKEPLTGKYKLARAGSCIINEFLMETSFPFTQVLKSKEKAKVLWDEATKKGMNICSNNIKRL